MKLGKVWGTTELLLRTPFIEVHLQAICIKIPCPKRVFMGSERGELASAQDDSQWNDGCSWHVDGVDGDCDGHDRHGHFFLCHQWHWPLVHQNVCRAAAASDVEPE